MDKDKKRAIKLTEAYAENAKRLMDIISSEISISHFAGSSGRVPARYVAELVIAANELRQEISDVFPDEKQTDKKKAVKKKVKKDE